MENVAWDVGVVIRRTPYLWLRLVNRRAVVWTNHRVAFGCHVAVILKKGAGPCFPRGADVSLFFTTKIDHMKMPYFPYKRTKNLPQFHGISP